MTDKERIYNATGLMQLLAATMEFIPMVANGSDSEVQDAIRKIYETAAREFPDGIRSGGLALNLCCAELDLPLIFSPRNKDTGELV